MNIYEFQSKRYQIYTGTRNTSSYRPVAAYDSRAWFVKKLKQLKYPYKIGKKGKGLINNWNQGGTQYRLAIMY
ncbi:MAG: hypothetical protein II817_00680 [Bacteroidales bacterium]|nr:hypothetical protein [Bacteroidales bacterium]